MHSCEIFINVYIALHSKFLGSSKICTLSSDFMWKQKKKIDKCFIIWQNKHHAITFCLHRHFYLCCHWLNLLLGATRGESSDWQTGAILPLLEEEPVSIFRLLPCHCSLSLGCLCHHVVDFWGKSFFIYLNLYNEWFFQILNMCTSIFCNWNLMHMIVITFHFVNFI